MTPWRFMDYVTEEGANPIQEWYDQQDDAVRAEFDQTLLTLMQTDDWEADDVEAFKVLTAEHVGLSELRFYVDERPPGRRKATRRRFRPLGIYNREKREFLLLGACEKKGMNTIPRDAFDSAMRLKGQFEQSRGRTCEHA